MSKRKCSTCRFVVLCGEEPTKYLSCYRFSPIPSSVPSEPTRYPTVKADDWCWEYISVRRRYMRDQNGTPYTYMEKTSP